MGLHTSKESTQTESTTIEETESYHYHYYHHGSHHHSVAPPPTYPESPTKPTRMTTTSRPITSLRPGQPQRGADNAQGLEFPAILFISIGSVVLLIIFIVCLVITWKHCKRRKLTNWREESMVGRAIQRASFFPRFSRYRNQPVVLNYPDPDSHLPNYALRTPYTFSSQSTLASVPGTTIAMEPKNIQDIPSYRATIY